MSIDVHRQSSVKSIKFRTDFICFKEDFPKKLKWFSNLGILQGSV